MRERWRRVCQPGKGGLSRQCTTPNPTPSTFRHRTAGDEEVQIKSGKETPPRAIKMERQSREKADIQSRVSEGRSEAPIKEEGRQGSKGVGGREGREGGRTSRGSKGTGAIKGRMGGSARLCRPMIQSSMLSCRMLWQRQWPWRMADGGWRMANGVATHILTTVMGTSRRVLSARALHEQRKSGGGTTLGQLQKPMRPQEKKG